MGTRSHPLARVPDKHNIIQPVLFVSVSEVNRDGVFRGKLAGLSPSFPERAAWGTAKKLRAWQEEALGVYFNRDADPATRRDFLVSATPGAGKTTFALRLTAGLLEQKIIDRVCVVVPTEQLKIQWADAAALAGIRLDPSFQNRHEREARHFRGVVLSYAQVALAASLHRKLTQSARTLVILDEIHHAGDSLSWGDAVWEAFAGATRRVSLTGTPFRSDLAPIPFVRYLRNENGVRVSQTDYSYGYSRALRDGVVRPVIFLSYAGSMRWRTRSGEEMEANLGQGDTRDITTQAWRTALDPEGEWMPAVLSAADRRLGEVRQHVLDAGGLVIATDHKSARAYAKILTQITGVEPTLVLSDDTTSGKKIADFARGTTRWMVAVRMVSEGVDVPRLSVGVYATNAATPLYFAQAIGRFVRSRRRGELASIFLPSVPVLAKLAAEMEHERDHALDRESPEGQLFEQDFMAQANRQDFALAKTQDEFSWAALSSLAQFEKVMFAGEEYGALAEPGTLEEWDFIGIPGLLDAEQVSDLLRHRQARQARRVQENPETSAPIQPLHRTLAEQRRLLNSLVGIHARSTGLSHAQVHAQVRNSCGGPAVAKASQAQLQRRIELLRRYIGSG